jgi:hypothetical protein
MGRRRRPGIPQKANNLIRDLVGNEENEYPVPNSNKMMLIMTNKPNYDHKKTSQKGNYE